MQSNNTTYVVDPNLQTKPTLGQKTAGMFSSHGGRTAAEVNNLPPAGTLNQGYGPNAAYQSNMGPGYQQGYQQGYGQGYGPAATTTTTTVVKEVDSYGQAGAPMRTGPGPMVANQGMTTGPGYTDNYDKHGKPKKAKKEKKSKKNKNVYQDNTKLKGQQQVIVPPGPAIVPAVVIPVIGAPPMNSAFVQGFGNQPGYGNQYGNQPGYGPAYGNQQMPAPTSGVLPPTGVQNPMTATLPVNMQGVNPTSHLQGGNIGVQPPIMSTAGCDAQCTKQMIGKSYPVNQNVSGTNTSYNSAYADQGPMMNNAQYTGAGLQDTTIKKTVVEERKEILEPGVGMAPGRQF